MTRRARSHLLLTAFAVAFGCERSSISPDPATSTNADAAQGDAGADSSSADVVSPPLDANAFDAALPSPLTTLSQTGLYADIANKTLAPGVESFTPASPLWSDGADKHRYVALPPGSRIDTSDMDHWRFPVGARFYKEFARDGKRLETRLIARIADTGNPETDYFAGAFLWRDDESDADFVPAGKVDVRGTDHDVPAQTRCFTCHVGEPGRILGFSALQLSTSESGLTVKSLSASGRLTAPPAGTDTPFPSLASAEGRALAYLHANCGHCHNPAGSAWPDAQMVLRLSTAESAPANTALVKSTVGVALTRWKKSGFDLRVTPGDAGASGLHYRMSVRGGPDQMPPFATEHTDPTGLAAIAAWIDGL